MTAAAWCGVPCGMRHVQVWWTCLALLHSPSVAVYGAALRLMTACQELLKLSAAKVRRGGGSGLGRGHVLYGCC